MAVGPAAPKETDPREVQRHGLQGMVAAGSRPSDSPETWRQGPPRSVAQFSLAV